MNIDWLSILIGWIGGIPTGLFVNWLFLRFTKRPKGDYFTVTYQSGGIHFEVEGQNPRDVRVEEVVKQLLGREEG